MWEERLRPDSKAIWDLGKRLLEHSKPNNRLWFYHKYVDKEFVENLSDTLLREWPRPLGSVAGAENHWDLRDPVEKLEPDSELKFVSTRYRYRDEGGLFPWVFESKSFKVCSLLYTCPWGLSSCCLPRTPNLVTSLNHDESIQFRLADSCRFSKTQSQPLHLKIGLPLISRQVS